MCAACSPQFHDVFDNDRREVATSDDGFDVITSLVSIEYGVYGCES
jgi:hypothetical protein